MAKMKYLKIIVIMCVAISCVAVGYLGMIDHDNERLEHKEEKKDIIQFKKSN